MRHLIKHLVVGLVTISIFLSANSQAQVGIFTEAEQIERARKYFDNKNYLEALPLYSQIVSNHPGNATHNYYLGVCLLKIDGDKADAVRFLKVATQSSETPINSFLFLGTALHQAYRFDEAIVSLQTFKKSAGKQGWKDSGGEQLITMCQNAINRNNDLSLARHSIFKETETKLNDFINSYKNIASAGRFLKVPKEYESKDSKDKPEGSYLFLSSNGNMMVFAGLGKSGQTGMDIFKVTKDAKGLWLFPEPISSVVNTKYDEAYPVLVNDGKTLYYSSKGSGSMGGYDIFKSDYDMASGSWSEPVPLGSPVNSPGNDFYYVPASDQTAAYFSSERESPSGKCKVYSATVINENRNFVSINGTFSCQAGLDLSDAKITILNADDRSLLAQFRTASQNGIYFLKLPVSTNLIYQVKLAGFNDLESTVELGNYTNEMLIQEIIVKREGSEKESLYITTRVAEKVPEMLVINTPITIEITQSIPAEQNANKSPTAKNDQLKKKTIELPKTKKTTPAESASSSEKESVTETAVEPVDKKTPVVLVSIVNMETINTGTDVAAKTIAAETETELPLFSKVNPETNDAVEIKSGKMAPAEKINIATPIVHPVAETKTTVAEITKMEYVQTVAAANKNIIKPDNAKQNNFATENNPEVLVEKNSKSKSVQKVPAVENNISATENIKTAINETVMKTMFIDSLRIPISQASVKITMQDVIFKVQLGLFKNSSAAVLKKKFEATGISDLEFISKKEGYVIVLMGRANNYETAVKLKEVAIDKGVKDAFVVVYSGENRLPVSLVVFEEE